MDEADAISDGATISDGAIRGRSELIPYLRKLRRDTTAHLLVVTDGTPLITLDYTRTTRGEGSHLCADEIVFDESGCIKEFRHCATHH